MKEDFLHYLWRYQRFDWTNLQTTQGEPITVLHTGEYNTNAGPDFLNARIQIHDTVWAGNVEIHLRSSEWKQHGHNQDPAYDSVVLHVVLEDDEPVCRPNGMRIPCLELARRVPPGLQKQYFHLLQKRNWIPCELEWPGVPDMTKQLWLERLLVERLENRIQRLSKLLEQNGQDWEETFYQSIARNLGQPVNADPMEYLARMAPLNLIGKHRNNILQIESLLFGQAGLLEAPVQDDYPAKLQEEYRFLKHKYRLLPMTPANWKFLRMRPAGFPTVRIAQLAMLLHHSNSLFSKAMSANSVQEWEQMLELHVSHYWRTHYLFDKASTAQVKTLGRNTIHSLLINTVAPFLFLYGIYKEEGRYREKAIQLLEELPPEDNHITRSWAKLGFKAASAAQTQALLQLKGAYCTQQRCLHCAVGHAILKSA